MLRSAKSQLACRAVALGLALLAAAPAVAQADTSTAEAAERRLRTCLSTGAPSAPRESLGAAVAALRSLCYRDIKRLEEFRLDEAERRLNLPASGLTIAQKVERERTRDEAVKALNFEIARAISTLTGLMDRDAANN